jgi:hypothetical protein
MREQDDFIARRLEEKTACGMVRGQARTRRVGFFSLFPSKQNHGQNHVPPFFPIYAEHAEK